MNETTVSNSFSGRILRGIKWLLASILLMMVAISVATLLILIAEESLKKAEDLGFLREVNILASLIGIYLTFQTSARRFWEKVRLQKRIV